MKAIVYCRRSTDREDNQILSLESQMDFCVQMAKREWLDVVEVVEESQSASSPGRPWFAKMLGIISSRKADCIVCWKMNRLARNSIDAGTITWMLQNWGIQRIFTSDGIYTPDTNSILLSVLFWMSTQYTIDLRKDVIRGMETAVKKWQVVQKAPLWYKHDKNTKQIYQTEQAEIIKKIFEWRAEWQKIKDIGDQARKLWLKTTNQNIEFIIKNPFYYGLMAWRWELHRGSYDPIISKSIFDKANSVPKKHTRTVDHTFYFKGIARAHDGKQMKAYLQKGHVYYKNGKINISEKYIFDEISEAFEKLEIQKEKLDDFRRWVIDFEKNEMLESIKLIDGLERQKKTLLAKREWLFDMRIGWEITREDYARKNNEIQMMIVDIEEEIREAQKMDDDLKEKLDILVELLEMLSDKGKIRLRQNQVSIFSSLVVELIVYPEKELAMSFFPCFQALFDVKNKNGGPSLFWVELFERVYRWLKKTPIQKMRDWRGIVIGVK